MGIFYDEQEQDYYDDGGGELAPVAEYIEIPDRLLLSRRSSHSIAVEYGVTAAEIDAARREVRRTHRPPPRRPTGSPRPRRPTGPRVVDHRRGKKRKRKVRVSRSVLRKLLGGGWF